MTYNLRYQKEEEEDLFDDAQTTVVSVFDQFDVINTLPDLRHLYQEKLVDQRNIAIEYKALIGGEPKFLPNVPIQLYHNRYDILITHLPARVCPAFLWTPPNQPSPFQHPPPYAMWIYSSKDFRRILAHVYKVFL